MNELVDPIIDILWDIKYSLRNKENRTSLEDEFLSDFRYWNKGDCSPVGACKLLLWYVASVENQDPWRQNEYGELIDKLKSC